MTLERTTIESHLQSLQEILDQLDRITKSFATDPDHHQSIYRIFEVIQLIVDLRADLWDVEPDLVDPTFVARTEVDLASAVEWLRRGDPEKRSDLIRELMAHAPKSVVYAAATAGSEEDQCRILCEWWEAADRPVKTLDNLDRELDQTRRWRRVVAARVLKSMGVEDLIDPATGDIDQAALTRWRASRSP